MPQETSSLPSWFSRIWLGSLLLGLPLAQWPGLEDPLVTPWTIWICLSGLACLLLGLARHADGTFRHSRMRSGLRIFFVFALVYAVALPDALHPGEAFIAWGRIATGALVLFLTWHALREGEPARRMAGRMAAVSILLQGVWALPILAFHLDPTWSPLSVSKSPIPISEWSVMLVPIMAMQLRTEIKQAWRWLIAIAMVVAAVIILLSVVRSSLVGLTVGAAVTLVLVLLKRKTIALTLPLKPLLIAVGLLVSICGIVWLVEPTSGPFHTMGKKWGIFFNPPDTKDHPTGVSERQSMWDGTVEMISEHWTSGVGPGQWKYHAPQYGAYSFKTTYADRFFEFPHNDMLWVFAEAGLPALVAWVFFLAWCLVMLISSYRRGDADRAFTAACAMGGWTAFLVMGVFSYPMSQPLQFSSFLLLMACAADRSDGEKDEEDQRQRIISFRVLQVLLMLLCAGMLAIGFLRMTGERNLHLGKKSYLMGDGKEATEHLLMVNDTWVVSDREGLAVAYWRGLATRGGNDLQIQLRHMEDAVSASPFHPPVLTEAARTASEAGSYDAAAAWLRSAIAIHPCHFEARLLLAETYMRTSRFELARDALSAEKECQQARLYESFRERADKLQEIMPRQEMMSLDSLVN